MPNRDESPTPQVLSGSIGPIETLWNQFAESNDLNDPQFNVKFLFYLGATAAYNLIVNSMRVDPTLKFTVKVTADMKADIETFFARQPGPFKH